MNSVLEIQVISKHLSKSSVKINSMRAEIERGKYDNPSNIAGFIVVSKHSSRTIHGHQNPYKTTNVDWEFCMKNDCWAFYYAGLCVTVECQLFRSMKKW